MPTTPAQTRPPLTVAEAKAALRTWGDESQAKLEAVQARAGKRIDRLATGGGITLIAALLIHKLIPRRTSKAVRPAAHPVAPKAPQAPHTHASHTKPRVWIRWLTIARVSRWLAPHVLNAITSKPRPTTTPTAPPTTPQPSS